MDVKQGKVFIDEDGNVLTIRGIDEADRVIADVEGDFKTFDDQDSFKSFVEENGFEMAEIEVNDAGDDEGDIEEPEDTEGEEESEEEEEDPKQKRIRQFKDLYTQMLDLGSTGNDKIDKAVQKLKKELSSELNTITNEDVDFDSIYNDLKEDGYIQSEE